MRRAGLVVSLLALVPTLLAAQTDAGNDYTPGDRVLLAPDFAKVATGMFPRALRLESGNAEVATVDGRAVLRVTGWPTAIVLPLAEQLPERFTLEFDYKGAGHLEMIRFAEGETHHEVRFDWLHGGLAAPDGSLFTSTNGIEGDEAQWVRIAVMADGNYVKVYNNGVRVANLPTADLGRSRRVVLQLTGEQERPVLVANLRLAAGGKDLYRALLEDGRITLEGIEFDTGSDRLRPSSDTVLARAAAALLRLPDLVVDVEGHTDSTGTEAANQALSARRAAAVVARLTAGGIPAAQLKAKGYGASRPVASNETPEGRQRNRRVELVRSED